MGSRKNFVVLKRLMKKGFHPEISGHIKPILFTYPALQGAGVPPGEGA